MTDCINYKGRINPKQYGRVTTPDGRTTGAHRQAYENRYGKIPDGLYVCHKCDNRACINTEHLFLGTAKDNAEDMVRKGRSLRGEKNHKSRLNSHDIMNIRRQYYDGLSAKAIALTYDTTRAYIYNVVYGKCWNHLPVMPAKESGGTLNPEKARQIRELSRSGKTGKSIAEMFNVTRATISRVINNKTFAGGDL